MSERMDTEHKIGIRNTDLNNTERSQRKVSYEVEKATIEACLIHKVWNYII